MTSRTLLLLVLLVGIPYTASAQTTTGKDFWLGFMYNDAAPNHPVELTVYLSSGATTLGTVSVPGTKWTQEFHVSPGKGSEVRIPADLGMAIGTESIQKRAVHIVSEDSVACFALNYSAHTADASVILPTKALGREYLVAAYSVTSYPSELMVVPTLDSTVIEITPHAKTDGGHPANIPFTVTLNAGDVYQVQSGGDLTGSRVVANRGIAVFGGSACASIPAGADFSDHLYDQMYPLTSWGKHFVTVPLRTRKGDTFRFLASEDSTKIRIDTLPPIVLNAGAFFETIIHAPSSISSTKPIAIAQYSNSSLWDKVDDSDPFMTMLSPNEQMQSQVTFNAFESKVITAYYLNIVTHAGSRKDITLDGKHITTDLKVLPTDPRYAYGALKITVGDHTLLCDSGFIAYVYGFGPAESYGYSAGASIKAIQHFARVSGVARDKKTGKPISCEIVYENLGSGVQAGNVHTNPESGAYTAILPVGTNYGVHAAAQGYYAVSDHLDASDTTDDLHFARDLELAPIEVGMVVRLNNVFFDVNLSVLRSESFPELDRVVKLMKENKEIAIAISGHTDNVGSDEKNLTLSEDRAKAVMQYIVQAGVESGRVTSTGFGKTKPIATNDTEEGRQQNRRVEFAIVK